MVWCWDKQLNVSQHRLVNNVATAVNLREGGTPPRGAAGSPAAKVSQGGRHSQVARPSCAFGRDQQGAGATPAQCWPRRYSVWSWVALVVAQEHYPASLVTLRVPGADVAAASETPPRHQGGTLRVRARNINHAGACELAPRDGLSVAKRR